MYFFHIELPSVQLQRRFEKFLANAANERLMTVNVITHCFLVKAIFVLCLCVLYHSGE